MESSDARVVDVFIVGRVQLYQQGLAQALSRNARLRVVGVAATHEDALARMRGLRPRPGVALVDIGPGLEWDGLRRLDAALGEVAFVALGVADTDADVIACAETGVAGFVTRDTSLDGLVATILAVAQGGARCSPRATAALMRRVAGVAGQDAPGPRTARLTPRERQIVALIDRGLSNKQIAYELKIELATVKNHVHSILDKLRVERRGAAAAAVRRQGAIGG